MIISRGQPSCCHRGSVHTQALPPDACRRSAVAKLFSMSHVQTTHVQPRNDGATHNWAEMGKQC